MTEKNGYVDRISGWAGRIARKLVSPFHCGEPAAGAKRETTTREPPHPPGSGPDEAGNPWPLGTLGGCSFHERAAKMDSLIECLSRMRRVPYLNADWVVHNLHRWATEVIPGLKLNSGLERVCSGAAKTLAGELIVEIRDDPREGRVIWVPPEDQIPGRGAGVGKEGESPTPFVRGDRVFHRLHRWIYSIIPECPAIDDQEKTACGRVVLEIAWEIADNIRDEEAPGHGLIIWVPEVEIVPTQEEAEETADETLTGSG